VAALATLLPLFAEQVDAAEEGKKVLLGMLITGLIFVGVIALGETSKYLRHRRRAH
jgi:RsiW-degrading membrane proteinase PrsW (M82 family)